MCQCQEKKLTKMKHLRRFSGEIDIAASKNYDAGNGRTEKPLLLSGMIGQTVRNTIGQKYSYR